ncbi:hypothetical protein GF314_01920 [bacterium]|nr:hypothetical protein [bacterium]
MHRRYRSALLLLAVLLAGTTLAVEVTHGPVIGGVTDEQARFVVRTDTEATVTVELSTDAGDFSAAIVSTTLETDAGSDYFGTLDVVGLAPATPYFFRVIVDAVPGEVQGPFETYPVPGTTPGSFSFGFGSCQQAITDDISFDGAIWPLVDAAGLKFFVHTGDWGYPDYVWEVPNGFPPYFHQIPGQLEDSYKVRYDPEYPMHEIFDTVPIDYVYDDHDYTHNNSDGSYEDKMLSVEAYMDYFPGYALPRPDLGIYHSFVYGNCEFFVLDNRTLRDPNIFAFPNFMEWLADPSVPLYYAPDPATHRLWGEEQLAWLLDGLSGSTATWKFVVSTMPWNPGHRAGVELALALQGNPDFDPIDTPSGQFTAAEVAVEFSDGGAGFPFDMAAVRGHVADHGIENVILLSGDSHTACLDSGANSPMPEWMAGGLDRTNGQIVALQEQFGIFTWDGPGQHFGQDNFDEHYGKVIVDGDESVTIEIYDTEGTIIATDTVAPGFVPSPVNATVAPQGALLEDVPVGGLGVWPVFVTNTGRDAVSLLGLGGLEPPFEVVGLTPAFEVDPGFSLPAVIEQGQKQILGVVFTPAAQGVYQDTLGVVTNDPDGPVGVVCVGTSSTVSIEDPGSGADLPTPELTLLQNTPNPFNPATTVQFALTEASHVRLEVFDLRGRLVRTLADQVFAAGGHVVAFDGRDLASGTYMCRLEGEGFARSIKMSLVK